MTRSAIQKLRDRFERSNQYNGNPDLEDSLTKYIEHQTEIALGTGNEMIHARAVDCVEEARDMLTQIQSRYRAPGVERG